jgi:hypothetical protein
VSLPTGICMQIHIQVWLPEFFFHFSFVKRSNQDKISTVTDNLNCFWNYLYNSWVRIRSNGDLESVIEYDLSGMYHQKSLNTHQ